MTFKRSLRATPEGAGILGSGAKPALEPGDSGNRNLENSAQWLLGCPRQVLWAEFLLYQLLDWRSLQSTLYLQVWKILLRKGGKEDGSCICVFSCVPLPCALLLHTPHAHTPAHTLRFAHMHPRCAHISMHTHTLLYTHVHTDHMCSYTHTHSHCHAPAHTHSLLHTL